MMEGKRAVAKKLDVVEDTVDDLKHEQKAIVDDRRRRRQRSNGVSKPRWLVTALFVMVTVGTISFFAARGVSQVDANTKAISDKCQLGNEQIKVINNKLNQLNLLIDAAINNGGAPPSPEVAEAFELLRQPIALKACDR